MSYVVWFDDYVENDHWSVLGSKNVSLGEMTNAGLPVPPGFGLTTAAYAELKQDEGAQAEINGLLRQVDLDDVADLPIEQHRVIKHRIDDSRASTKRLAATARKSSRLCHLETTSLGHGFEITVDVVILILGGLLAA